MTVFAILAAVILMMGSGSLRAQEPPASAPLSFQAWKDQQVLEAQNLVLRVSARISSLKSAKAPATHKEPAHLANGKLRKVSDTETLGAAEQDLKRAYDGLATANNLQFEEYVEVYVPTLAGHPEAIEKLAEKFTKEELSVIVKTLMTKSDTAYDAQRKSVLAESLGTSPRPKTP